MPRPASVSRRTAARRTVCARKGVGTPVRAHAAIERGSSVARQSSSVASATSTRSGATPPTPAVHPGATGGPAQLRDGLRLRHPVRLARTADPVARQDFADAVIHPNGQVNAVPDGGDDRGRCDVDPSAVDEQDRPVDNFRRLSAFAVKTLGPKVTADTGEWGTYAWSSVLLGARHVMRSFFEDKSPRAPCG
jgi:hypothetical protein